MSSKKKFQKYSSSIIGIILFLCVVIAFNALISKIQFRVDLTEEKLFTLSDGTKKIISKLENPVNFRFYRSRSDNRMPVQLAGFAERIRDLLDEYVKNSNGKITIEEFDPTPDSDAEDAAALDGISGQAMPDGEKLYLGLAVTCLDKTVTIPFFFPHEEAITEYKITSAIDEAVSADKKKKIGIITELPILGGPMAMFMRRNPRDDTWLIASELKRRFEIIQIKSDEEEIPKDLSALLIIHPKNISEKTLFAIDQYLMAGGKLLIALDSYCITESRNNPQAMMGQPVPPGSSNIPKFLEKWKIEFSDTKVVADLNNSMRNINSPNAEVYPTVLDFRNFAEKNSDPAISNINHVNMVYAGCFTGSPAEGLKLEKIIKASDNSALVDSFLAEVGNDQVMKGFKKDMTEKILVAKLSGKFKTTFPDGKPQSNNDKPAESENAQGKDDKKVENTEKPKLLTESPETVVILISDVDMFADDFCVQKQNFLGTTIIQPFNDNLVLLQNIIEQLSGSPELLTIRSKNVIERPFTRIVSMLNQAQEKYQQEIQNLEKTREEVESKINELQRGKSGSQQFILTKEQKEQIEKYRKEAAMTAKKLKETRKELRKDIDELQIKLQIINAAAVPIALVAIGIAVWLNSIRRRSK